MNIFVQREPRSIALRSTGTNPFALIFRHAAREETTVSRCVVEFLPWNDISDRGDYKLLNQIEAFGCLGLIDVDEGTLLEKGTR